MDEVILTTCPRDCYDAWGVMVARRDGAIRHVRGDRSHPVSRGRLCVKCATAYNGVLRDPSARLLAPLKRDGPKGSGRYVEVSWEQALDQIARRLGAIVADAGPAAILNAHYTRTFALLGYFFGMRFFNRLGATEVDPGTICNKAGHVALDYMLGASTTVHGDEVTVRRRDAA
jgi:anaerobic selenocysteine-containing dehydrogenase